jgi:hypothetical protein
MWMWAATATHENPRIREFLNSMSDIATPGGIINANSTQIPQGTQYLDGDELIRQAGPQVLVRQQSSILMHLFG